MNENKIEKIITPPNYRALKPISVGEIPQVYMDSLTYAEQILDLIKYIRDVVYPTLKNVIDTTNENIDIMNETLESYKTTLDNLIGEIENFKTQITNEWNTYQETVNNKLTEYEELYNNFQTSITSQFNAFKTSVNNSLNNMTTDINNFKTSTTNIVNNGLEEIDKMVSYLTNGATVLNAIPESEYFPKNLNPSDYPIIAISNEILNYEPDPYVSGRHLSAGIQGGVEYADGTEGPGGDILDLSVNYSDVTHKPSYISGFIRSKSDFSIQYLNIMINNGKFVVSNTYGDILTTDGDNLYFNVKKLQEAWAPDKLTLLRLNNSYYTGNGGYVEVPITYYTVKSGATPSEYTYFSNILARMEEIIETGKIDVTADFTDGFNNLQSQINSLRDTVNTDVSNLTTSVGTLETETSGLNNSVASINNTLNEFKYTEYTETITQTSTNVYKAQIQVPLNGDFSSRLFDAKVFIKNGLQYTDINSYISGISLVNGAEINYDLYLDGITGEFNCNLYIENYAVQNLQLVVWLRPLNKNIG